MTTPNIPIVNAGDLYITGLRLANDSTTPDEIVTIGIGQCRDSTNANDIVVDAAISASNVVSGAGGLDTGTVAASTLYYVHVIGDSTGYNSPTGLLSLSKTAPVIPGGYDMFRRVGAVSTDGTSDNQKFQQTGNGHNRTTVYDSGTLGVTTTGLPIPSSATTASQTLASIGVFTSLIPQSAIELHIYASLVANAAGDSLMLAPYGFTAASTMFRTNASGTVEGHVMQVPCNINTVQQAYYATSSATATVAFTLCGYVDEL